MPSGPLSMALEAMSFVAPGALVAQARDGKLLQWSVVAILCVLASVLVAAALDASELARLIYVVSGTFMLVQDGVNSDSGGS